MTQIFIVFIVLLVVVIASLAYEPANPFDAWLKLAERYQTSRRPSEIQFTNQVLMFGAKRVKRLNDFARFDVTIDDFGLWIIFRNNDQEEIPDALKIRARTSATKRTMASSTCSSCMPSRQSA